jgi:hypothetical protein
VSVSKRDIYKRIFIKHKGIWNANKS